MRDELRALYTFVRGMGKVYYLSLQVSDEQSLEDLASFVRVANILECFCGVLTADVEENFLTASVA